MVLQRISTGTPLCRLESALGRQVTCTEERCPFWEPGGAVLDGRCAFEWLDLARESPSFAAWLCEIRSGLESSRARADEHPRRLLNPLLNEGAGE